MLAGAVVMSWPALLNRYPLLYPDSIGYICYGRTLVGRLFLHESWGNYGYHPLVYTLGIWFLHWDVTPWPIVALNALLTSYVLWLVLRTLMPGRALLGFSALVFALSLLTGLGWIVGWAMPDILGPVLYLAIYLLVFAADSLSRFERLLLGMIAWWCITAHATHMLLGAGLYFVSFVLLLALERSLRRSFRATAPVLLVLLAAALSQIELNKYIYGETALNGNRPPYILTRVMVDGPGRRYLEEHCSELHLAMCQMLDELPDNHDDFLWGPNGWDYSDPEKRKVLQDEEAAVVWGTVRTYPREELKISAGHVWHQLLTFNLDSYEVGEEGHQWMTQNVEEKMPGQGARFEQSLQAHDKLPWKFCTAVQKWTVIASVAVIAAGIVILRRRMPRRLAALTVTVVCAVLANAAVTGILSDVDERYQSRIIWMAPMLAVIYLVMWFSGAFLQDRIAGEGRENSPSA